MARIAAFATVAGVLLITTAGFLLHPTAGLTVAGAALLAFGLLVDTGET